MEVSLRSRGRALVYIGSIKSYIGESLRSRGRSALYIGQSQNYGGRSLRKRGRSALYIKASQNYWCGVSESGGSSLDPQGKPAGRHRRAIGAEAGDVETVGAGSERGGVD